MPSPADPDSGRPSAETRHPGKVACPAPWCHSPSSETETAHRKIPQALLPALRFPDTFRSEYPPQESDTPLFPGLPSSPWELSEADIPFQPDISQTLSHQTENYR